MRRLLLLLLLVSGFWHLTPIALAKDYQQCTTSTTCTIGEFLYNDDYSVLTGQTCTLTAKYPDGTAFLTSAAMTGRADGWYSYDATLGTTEGLYAASICCTPSSGRMCLDKSFEVKVDSTTLTPADIWGYSNRTLTSYGNLVSDVWGYSSRSLTTFGSLISDIWGYSSKTLTSFGSLVTDILGNGSTTSTTSSPSPGTLSAVVAEQKQQRELLEKLVNAPVVSLSLDEGTSFPDLETKLDESKKQASLLYDTLSSTKARILTLDAKWDHLNQSTAIEEITALATPLQSPESLSSLTHMWDIPPVTILNQEWVTLKSSLANLLTTTTIVKSALAPPTLMASLALLSHLEDTLGDTTHTSTDPTFFGYLATVWERNTLLVGENQKIAGMLENINGQGTNVSTGTVNSLKARLLALNQYPGGESLASPAKASDNPQLNLKNMLFGLQGLIGLNRQLLAVNAGDPVRGLWLEEGSIIFRAVITNPSSVISQSVPLKFYLPREVKTDDIIMLDPSLETTYDAKEEALYAHGTYDLKPKETKIVYVEIEDIWRLTSDEIQSLRTQATSLLQPLVKTAYYSQGITLKSDIDVTLDKVLLASTKAITPENRIRAYREGKLELTKVTANMNRLQDLVAQASGTGSLFGFVGGVQTVAVWGIILVFVAGFVFLTLYFKKLGITPKLTPSLPTPEVAESPVGSPNRLTPLELPLRSPPAWQMPAIIAVVIIATAGGTLLLTRLAKPKSPVINEVVTTPPPSPIPSPSPEPVGDDILIKNPKDVLGETAPQFTLTIPPDSSVNIRNKPSPNADIIMAVKNSVDIYVFKESGDWRQIGFSESDLTKGYWVNVKFIGEK